MSHQNTKGCFPWKAYTTPRSTALSGTASILPMTMYSRNTRFGSVADIHSYLASAVLGGFGLFGLAPGGFLGAALGLFCNLGGLGALALQAVLRIVRGSGRHYSLCSWDEVSPAPAKQVSSAQTSPAFSAGRQNSAVPEARAPSLRQNCRKVRSTSASNLSGISRDTASRLLRIARITDQRRSPPGWGASAATSSSTMVGRDARWFWGMEMSFARF